MDIIEILEETEELKARVAFWQSLQQETEREKERMAIELFGIAQTTQKLAEAKKLLSKILWNVPYFKAQLPGNLILDAIGKDIEEFLQ